MTGSTRTPQRRGNPRSCGATLLAPAERSSTRFTGRDCPGGIESAKGVTFTQPQEIRKDWMWTGLSPSFVMLTGHSKRSVSHTSPIRN
jgi:hypothetical protein